MSVDNGVKQKGGQEMILKKGGNDSGSPTTKITPKDSETPL